MTPDERVEAQRRAALRRGNEIRRYRSKVKRDLSVGRLKLATVLRGDDQKLATMKLRDFLRATPGLGSKKTGRVFVALNMSATIPLENLDARRRELLLAHLVATYPGLRGRVS